MQSEQIVNETSVDLMELFARVENDRDLLRDVLQIFTEEFPKLQLLLKDGMQRGDILQVQTSAHTMKGMLASLSFRKASAAAFRIERMAGQSDLAGIPEEVIRLERDAMSAQANLEKFCGLAA